MVNTRRSVQYAAAARVTVTTAHSPITPQSSSHLSPPKRIHFNKGNWSIPLQQPTIGLQLISLVALSSLSAMSSKRPVVTLRGVCLIRQAHPSPKH